MSAENLRVSPENQSDASGTKASSLENQNDSPATESNPPGTETSFSTSPNGHVESAVAPSIAPETALSIENEIAASFEKLIAPLPAAVEQLVRQHENSESSLAPLMPMIHELLAQADTKKTMQYQIKTPIAMAKIFYDHGQLEEALYELNAAADYADYEHEDDLFNSIIDLINLLDPAADSASESG
jgi:hypothetical protein